ncbi:MAG: hypothetical protein QY312_01195 [Candidatus Dojkabacteria bacterium]|nr:MAG: hypothetical protein QY312_01195 [Candidatus Dojkabacteria bacterium]
MFKKFVEIGGASIIVAALVFVAMRVTTTSSADEAQPTAMPTETAAPEADETTATPESEAATPEAEAAEAATLVPWSAYVRIVDFQNDTIVDGDLTGRMEFHVADYPTICSGEMRVYTTKELKGDLDFSGDVNRESVKFAEAWYLVEGWNTLSVSHPKGECAFALQDITPFTYYQDVEVSSIAWVVITHEASGTILWQGDLYGRTEFHETDLPGLCGPLTIETTTPLRGDLDFKGTINGQDVKFAEVWYLNAGVNNMEIFHPTNCSFALQEVPTP